MFCTQCGNRLEEDARFCTQCGTQVDSDNEILKGAKDVKINLEEPKSVNQIDVSPKIEIVESVQQERDKGEQTVADIMFKPELVGDTKKTTNGVSRKAVLKLFLSGAIVVVVSALIVGAVLGSKVNENVSQGVSETQSMSSTGEENYDWIEFGESLGCDVGYVNISSGALNVRSHPSTDASVTGKLKDGTTVYVIDQHDGWSKVDTDIGIQGYVAADYIIYDDYGEETDANAIGIEPLELGYSAIANQCVTFLTQYEESRAAGGYYGSWDFVLSDTGCMEGDIYVDGVYAGSWCFLEQLYDVEHTAYAMKGVIGFSDIKSPIASALAEVGVDTENHYAVLAEFTFNEFGTLCFIQPEGEGASIKIDF